MREASKPRTGSMFISRPSRFCVAAIISPATADFTAARTWRSCVTASTRCRTRARRARSVLPVSIMVMACTGLISRVSRTVPPRPGCSPSKTSGKPKLASSMAMRKSQASATSSPPPRQKPWITATVGSGSRSRRSSTAWPRVSACTIGAGSVTPRNWAMSAPAMKPERLAERMTKPRGWSRSIFSSTALSSVSTSSDRVLALASFLSNKSQAMPSSSVRSRQWAQGPGSCGASSMANGPSSMSRLPRMASVGFGAGEVFIGPPSHCFDQHGAALAAADAFGGDAALLAEPLHGVDQVQHDAIAAGADRMAHPDRAAVDIEPVARDFSRSTWKPERLAAELVIVPGGKTAEHLRGEGFVELPQFDIAQTELMPFHERGRAIDRAEPHDRGVERRPFAVDDDRLRGELVRLHRVFGRQDDPRRAIGDLRRVAGRDLAPRPLERGFQLGQRVGRAVRPHAVIVIEQSAVAGEGRLDLA